MMITRYYEFLYDFDMMITVYSEFLMFNDPLSGGVYPLPLSIPQGFGPSDLEASQRPHATFFAILVRMFLPKRVIKH